MTPRPTTVQLQQLLIEATPQTAKDRGKAILRQEKNLEGPVRECPSTLGYRIDKSKSEEVMFPGI